MALKRDLNNCPFDSGAAVRYAARLGGPPTDDSAILRQTEPKAPYPGRGGMRVTKSWDRKSKILVLRKIIH